MKADLNYKMFSRKAWCKGKASAHQSTQNPGKDVQQLPIAMQVEFQILTFITGQQKSLQDLRDINYLFLQDKYSL